MRKNLKEDIVLNYCVGILQEGFKIHSEHRKWYWKNVDKFIRDIQLAILKTNKTK